MEEKIDAMDLESLVATLSTCNEKVHQLKSQYAGGVTPSMREMKDCRVALTEFMTKNSVECLQVNDELYARLYQRVGTGESLTPLLFMEVINDLTPASFMKTVQHIESERERRKHEWLEQQRKAVRKQLAQNKTLRAGGGRRRLTKRLKAESMAAVADSLGADAVKYVDDIVRAGSVLSSSVSSVSASESIQPLSPDDFDTEDDYVDAVVARMPFPEPEVKYTGKGKAYAQRPPPAFGRPLTAKEMCVEVLFELIRSRHKPVKPIVTVTSRPGKVAAITTVAPKPIFETIGKYVTLKNSVAKLQMENRVKRREYVTIMDRCKMRLQPLLGNTKYEGNLPTAEGLRKVAVEVVQTERVARRLSMWDIGCMMDSAVEDQLPKKDDAFQEAHVTDFLSEETMSYLIREVLRQIAEFTKANTVTHERVRLRRGRLGSPGDDDDELADSSDGGGSDSEDDESL